ncbi:MAG: PDZ domain-containing protein, partial [Desulfobacteraceae bacterium]|nr:PDZ domain-containing protein [Desulfobacteraceae bacterium]
VKPKDIIISVNGKTVDSARLLTGMIADTHVGDTIQIKINRDGKTRTIDVKIAKREETKIAGRSTQEKEQGPLGIQVSEITPETARRFNLKDAKGVIVTGVDPESKAAEAGLQIHDIIREINHKNITSVSDLNKTIDDIPEGETINLFIRRLNRGFLVIKITK